MTQAQLTADMMIGKYVEIRDEIEAKDNDHEQWRREQKAKLAKIETWLKDRLTHYDSDHFSSPDGDCFVDPATDRMIIGEPKPETFGDWVIHQYLETRDENIKALEKATETEVNALKELQAKREAWLKTQMDSVGTTTLKCADKAYAFKTYKDSVTVAKEGGWDEFLEWVKTGEHWEFLTHGANKTSVKERLAEFEERAKLIESQAKKGADRAKLIEKLEAEFGSPVPPGVNYSKVECVQVRRK